MQRVDVGEPPIHRADLVVDQQMAALLGVSFSKVCEFVICFLISADKSYVLSLDLCQVVRLCCPFGDAW